MSIKINVTETESKPDYQFSVQVEEDRSKTRHKVSMSRDFYNTLDTNQSPEEVIRKSFEFLLEREPKESILSEFDVTVISNYFPEYRETLQLRLKG